MVKDISVLLDTHSGHTRPGIVCIWRNPVVTAYIISHKGSAGMWRTCLKGQVKIVEIWLQFKLYWMFRIYISFLNTNRRVCICHFLRFSEICIDIFDSIRYAIRITQHDPWAWKENCLETWCCALLCIICRLTGSFVPDLIVSMSHQMWLHLQSDESVGSIGFKINYKGTQTDRIFCCLHWCLYFPVCFFFFHLSVLSCSLPSTGSETRIFYSSPAPL